MAHAFTPSEKIMASATPQQHRRAIAVLAVLLTAMRAAAAAGGCEGDKFPAGRSYAHCAALPKLGARLHWTHDSKTGSLSVAFVARPAGAGGAGWVSWAINPTGDGMKGAQALVAFRASPAAPYAVNTYNITGYKPLGASSTAIAFRATDLAADAAAAGEVRLYGRLQLAPGTEVVNHIWQVGSAVTAGAPAKHAFDKDNLETKGKLALSGAALAPAPTPAAAAGAGGSSAAKGGSGGGAAPSGAKPSAAATAAAAPVLTLLALAAGFMATV
ncbi:auxin-induced in root cultures protein 12-like [Panicum miliaceum]|uniref:Auxin-induced in root cultures protein 12-like n=1 Tax=Panicum miliaceum TaxID=4540 RepID=A0A3L6T8J2_PANMI|nr:auxin-induced in root cultures protein 12-like [Panicum miliaceum]